MPRFRGPECGALTLERASRVRGEAPRERDRGQLDRDADVELGIGAAGLEVLVEQVLELEAPDELVALDAPVGDVAADHAGAVAVAQAPDPPARQSARVE